MKRLGLAGILTTIALATGCGALLGLDDVELAAADGGAGVVVEAGLDAQVDAHTPPDGDGGVPGTWGACGQAYLAACDADETPEQAGCDAFVDPGAGYGGTGLSTSSPTNTLQSAIYDLWVDGGRPRHVCLLRGEHAIGQDFTVNRGNSLILDGGWRHGDATGTGWVRDCSGEDPRRHTRLNGRLTLKNHAPVSVRNLTVAGAEPVNGSAIALWVEGREVTLSRVLVTPPSGARGAAGEQGPDGPGAVGTAPEQLCGSTVPAVAAGEPGESASRGVPDHQGYTPPNGHDGGPGASGLPGRLFPADSRECFDSCAAGSCQLLPSSRSGQPGKCGDGGSGGGGGQGGRGGGASIALFAVGADITLDQVGLHASLGGAGGAGGRGGQGGSGSAGAVGGESPPCWTPSGDGAQLCCTAMPMGSDSLICRHVSDPGSSVAGCNGGVPMMLRGGHGEQGSPGEEGLPAGGGAGGPSYAMVLIDGSKIAVDEDSSCLAWGEGGAGGAHADPRRAPGAGGAAGPRYPSEDP